MSNNKTPGTDGLPVDFYKMFFNDISKNMVDCFNYSFQSSKLTCDQRRGIINLIPKKDNDPTFLKNWRPISLLNTDYKILTKCIASRLKNVLPFIIHNDQTGFLPGRYIGENIRLALDTIDYLNKNNLPGLMFMIDFHKAFDKLEWSFIFNTLNFFNFGPDLIKWVKLFYTDIYSCVMNNGHASDFFKLGCGVRQGCPLSPLLYIVCGEILSLLIKNNHDIEGIIINDTEILVSAFADDTTLYLRNVNSLKNAILILNNFQQYSGLAINLNKSELLPLGYYKYNPPDISGTGLNFCFGQVRLLGVLFTADLSNLFELNYIPKFNKLKNVLNIWQMRDLTPIGKITIVKSLGLSQLIFLFSILPKPPDNFLKELDTVLYKFIWCNKPDKVARKTIIGDYSVGGLRMMHIPSVITGLKIAWVKRLLDNNNSNWKCFYRQQLHPFGGNLIWYCNINPRDKCLASIDNSFIHEIVKSWFNVVFEPASSNFQYQILWNNSAVRIGNNIVFKKEWYDKGVKYFKDLLSENGEIMSFNVFKDRTGLNINFLEYFSLIYAIPQKWKQNTKVVDRDNGDESLQSDLLLKLGMTKKVCKLVHEICVQKIFKSPTSEVKWSLFFDEIDFNWKEIYCIALHSTLSIKLRYFQFKILHRYIAVNKLLHQMKVIDSDQCTFCNNKTEDIPHLFWECTVTAAFWKQVQTILMNNRVVLDMRGTLLGYLDIVNSKFNFVILYAKYFIYCCKINNHNPRLTVFIERLKSYKETERYIAYKNNTITKWSNRWNVINI